MSDRRTMLVAALALVVGLTGCDPRLTDINENPNGPLDVPAENLLAHALTDMLDYTLVYTLGMDMPALFVQHYAEIQYAEEDVYKFRTQNLNTLWADLYADPLMDLERMVEKAAGEDGNPNHTAVARIMQSWIFHIATDVWGDIPYSQALSGADDDGTITPGYDAQEDIYPDLLSTLAEAQSMLSSGAERTLQNGDLLYFGDMTAWQKFANSLRLRVAMRMADVAEGAARSAFEDALADGVFTSAADQAMFEYTGSNPYWNPIYDNSRTRDDHRVSSTIIDRLKELDDPRLAFYAQPVADAGVRASGLVYDGMDNGVEQHTIGFATKSKFGFHFFDPGAPYPIMTYAEVLFLRAEAAARGWNAGGSAEQLYEEAVTAAFELYDGDDYIIPGATSAEDVVAAFSVSQQEINQYLAQPDVAWNAAEWRERIGEQKWIALFNQGAEAFAEWRRLDYPMLEPGPDAYAPDIPLRIPYPSDEDSFNKASLEAALSRQGISGEGLGVAMWWDTN